MPSNSTPLKIIHLVSSLKVGGMERFVLRIAQAQVRNGHTVQVMALQGGPLEEQAAEMGVPVRALSGGMLRRTSEAAGYFWRFRPQIINAHNPSSLHYGALGKRVCGGRLLMTYHGRGLGGTRNPAPKEWKRTDVVVAVSGATADVVRGEAGPDAPEITVIHNGIEPASPERDRDQVRRELGLGEAFTGIVVARLDPLKDHASLLRSLSLLREQGVAMSLLIVGDGPERGNLERLAGELRLEDRVRFLGFRSDVADLLSASDVFVLPSTTEGLPLSVLEAMAQGVPVVATSVGGIPELIEAGESGLLVPVRSPEALTEALYRLHSDGALRAAFSRAGRERALHEFSFAAMVNKYDDLYLRLLGK